MAYSPVSAISIILCNYIDRGNLNVKPFKNLLDVYIIGCIDLVGYSTFEGRKRNFQRNFDFLTPKYYLVGFRLPCIRHVRDAKFDRFV